MPVFTDALIGDTTHLSMEEFGAYCMILFVTWRNNGQPLPDDDRRMARICRMSEKKWSAIRPTIAEFFDLSDGTWRQKRLEKEWKYVSEQREKQSEKGKKSAMVRQKSKISEGGNANFNSTVDDVNSLKNNDTASTAVVVRLEPQGQPNVNPHTHTQVNKDREVSTSLSCAPGSAAKKPQAQQVNVEFEEWYEQYPRKKDPKKALAAYLKARKTASREVLMEAVMRYSAECIGKDPQYIKHPTSWLNAEAWKNQPDLITRVNGDTNGRHHSVRSFEQRTNDRRAAIFDEFAPELERERARAH